MNNKNAESSQPSSPHIDSLVFFLDAFYRMFKIGIYYPVGHVTLDQSASKCLQLLREISPNFTSIHIVVKKDTMYLMDQEVPGKHTGAEELRKLMYEIGVQSIEMYRTVTHRDLLSFVRKILSWRSQLGANQGILDFNIGKLPSTIHLQQQEFFVDGSAKASSDTNETLYNDLDQISTALKKQGLSSGQVEQCRGLLEQISKNTAGKKINIAGFPHATWEDVQDLLFKIVTSRYDAEEKEFSPHMDNDINVIASILQSFEHDRVDEKSKETLQLLVAHLTARKTDHTAENANGKQKQKKRVRKRRSEVIDTVSTKVLETFIYKNAVPLEVLKKITGTDNSEALSILLQLLGGDLTDSFQELLESRVKLILSGPFSSRELEVIIGGIKSFADKAETPTFHRLVHIILFTMRSNGYDSLDFVVKLWSRMPHSMHLLLWPVVVNELLMVGMTPETKQSFYDALEIASHMHREGMYQLRPKIEKMEAFVENKSADVVFRPAFIYSYPLFAFLLHTSLANRLVIKIHRALLEEPQDGFIEAVIPLLDMAVPAHAMLLRNYLDQAHLKTQHLAQRVAAGEIILEFLKSATKEHKELPWVAQTIEATAHLNVKGLKQVLQTIVKDKKMGVFHTWPKQCRVAATKVLKKTSRQRLLDKL